MSTIQEQLPCPICSQAAYSWGNIFPQSLQFVADDANSLKNKIGDLMLKKVPARLCDNCGNIQMFAANFEESR